LASRRDNTLGESLDVLCGSFLSVALIYF